MAVNRIERRRYVPGMRSLSRYEMRRCGPAVLAVPPLAGITVGIASSLAGWQSLLLGEVLPVLVALPAAAVADGDPLRELHETLPRRYVRTAACRLGIAAGAVLTGVVAAAVLCAAFGGGASVLGHAAAALCSAVLLVGIGALVGAASSSAAAASTAMIAVWLGQLLLGDRILGDDAARLLVPACVGCAALALALRRFDSGADVLGAARSGAGS